MKQGVSADLENVALSDDEFDAGIPNMTRAKSTPGAPITGFSVDHDYLLGEHALDRTSYLIVGAIAAGWALVSWALPAFALSYPLFFSPFAYLVWRSRKTSQLILTNSTIRNFALAFSLAPIVLIILTMFLLVAFPVFDRTGSIYVTLWTIVFLQVFVEEVVKYRLIQSKVDIDETASVEIRQMQFMDLSRCLFTAMALSLGYGTYQGVSVSLLLAYSADGLVTPILISAVVAVLYIPSHCMTGYLIGLQLARRTVLAENLPAFAVIVWPVLFRSTFLFQFLFWIGTDRYPLLAWAVTSLLLSVVFVLYIRHVKNKLPRDYLDNAGYNVVLGYIPIVDAPV